MSASVWTWTNIASAGIALATTVTVSSTEYDDDGDPTAPEACLAFGFDAGVDFLSLPNFGSIADATYTDGSSTSRTISALYYTEPCTGSNDDDLHFCLNATTIPDTDETFFKISYNGIEYLRSDSTYNATQGSASTWRWLNINPNGPTSGTRDLIVFI